MTVKRFYNVNVFKGCDKLVKVNYLGTVDEWAQIYFKNGEKYRGKSAFKFITKNDETIRTDKRILKNLFAIKTSPFIYRV